MRTEPKTTKGRQTRERVLAAATTLVSSRGVRATSLDDVREAAGVSKSQLYHYFADKADLIRAVVWHTTDQVLAAQHPELGRLDSFEAIAAWFDQLVALQVERQAHGGCPIGSLVGQLAEHDEQAREQLAYSFDRWQAHLARGLQAMLERGLLVADTDCETVAQATMASIQGGLVLCQARRDPQQLRVSLDAALVFLRLHATTASQS